MKARVLVFAVGVGIIVATWQLWPSDERRIRRVVGEMAAVFDGRTTASDLERVARLAPLARALAPAVSVDGLPAPGGDGAALHGRDAVLAAAMAALRLVPDLRVTVGGISVDVTPDAPSATATAGLVISSQSGSDAAWRDIRELRLSFERHDNAWLVTHIAPETVLQP